VKYVQERLILACFNFLQSKLNVLPLKMKEFFKLNFSFNLFNFYSNYNSTSKWKKGITLEFIN
jgi:hypothetical protein